MPTAIAAVAFENFVHSGYMKRNSPRSFAAIFHTKMTGRLILRRLEGC